MVSLERAVTIRARLAADPITAYLVPPWDTWIADWKATQSKEIDLRIALLTANAVSNHWDDRMDDYSKETWDATDGDEPERLFYYKGQTHRQFAAPRHGVQYKKMGSWITHMAGSPKPIIVDIGKRLAPDYKLAGDAIQAAESADTAWREFRTTGERRTLVDRFNALGKNTEGQLKEMPFARPELRLPSDHVERFMRSGRSVVPATMEDLTKRRDDAKEVFDQAQAELDAAIQAEKDAADEEARIQRAADEKKLAEALAELGEKGKEIAELRAKLGLPEEPPKP